MERLSEKRLLNDVPRIRLTAFRFEKNLSCADGVALWNKRRVPIDETPEAGKFPADGPDGFSACGQSGKFRFHRAGHRNPMSL
ncbi:MAG: hypothetical protein ACOYJQ_13090 [Pseudochelatococcus sp.]|jgi:hypothetical protein|uniref:hypothetical protein n=1 Tax=Pseudochelatococcus sp. TaxID=2020869 RepID=UPI003D938011